LDAIIPGGGIVGGFLGAASSLFGFDNPANDLKARRYGFDFEKYFNNGRGDYMRSMPSRMATEGRAVSQSTSTVVSGNTFVIREEADVERVAEAITRRAYRRQPVVAGRR
jgi:hypothetical protein